MILLRTLLVLSFFLFTLQANIQINKHTVDEQKLLKSLKEFEKSFTSGLLDLNSIKKIVDGYIFLGDRYYNLQGYTKAKKYYQEAYKFHSKLARFKLSLVYEKEGDLYIKGKRYKKAYYSYNKAIDLGNKVVEKKIKFVIKNLKHQNKLKDDTRKIASTDAPQWTQAIGKLIIPTNLQKQKGSIYKQTQKCSATLVNFNDSEISKVIVTASHCISNFDKNAGTIKFLIKSAKGEMIQKFADIYMDSIYDKDRLQENSDYAVLILSSGIPKKDIRPLLVPSKSFEDMKRDYEYSFASLGGYSSDIGKHGDIVSYDPKCELERHSITYAKSTCRGYKGASGGPVVFNGSYDKQKFDNYFVGVVSHFKNGKYDQIFFSPHHIFYKYLQSAINQYNY